MSGTIHAFEHWLLNYRRVWHGTLFSSFVLPVLFMVGIGVSVGSYIDNTESLGGVSYMAFIAPGLLASTGLQTAAGEMTWPVYAALSWGNQYKAMRASPLTLPQILNGHLLYAVMRGLISIVVFCVVIGLFGVFGSPWAPLAILPCVLTVVAFSSWVYAYSISAKSEVSLSVAQRFGVVPITLFSGVFFPLSQLPDILEPVAWLSPLWHGAELSRWAISGIETPWWWGAHVGYLLLLSVLGWYCAYRCLRRRMTL